MANCCFCKTCISFQINSIDPDQPTMVVGLAVGLALALEEVPVADGVATVGAAEMVGMPHATQGDHHRSDHRLPTLRAIAFGDCVDAKLVALQHRVPPRGQLGRGSAAQSAHFWGKEKANWLLADQQRKSCECNGQPTSPPPPPTPFSCCFCSESSLSCWRAGELTRGGREH
jgi:hypothetical protein